MVRNRAVRKKKRNPGRLLVVLIVALALFGVVNSGRSVLKIIQLTRMKNGEKKTRNEALLKREQLREEAARLTADSLYIEEIARREFGMIKPGEEVYNITPPDTVKRTGKNVD
ncbi:MAG: FtsB family cell division protein [Candidatus Latescibacterota bacterium]